MRWTSRHDIVLIGLGMTGGAALAKMSPMVSGSVLVLDQGDDPRSVGVQPAEAALALDDPLTIPMQQDSVGLVYDGRSAELRKWWAGRYMGGGTHLWYGQLSRFRHSDLTRGSDTAGRPSPAPHELADWPFDFEALRPWYDWVEKQLLPYGCDHGHDRAQYTAFDGHYYRERAEPAHFERSVMSPLNEAGFLSYVGQTCLGGRSWSQHRRLPVEAGDLLGVSLPTVREHWQTLPWTGAQSTAHHSSCEVRIQPQCYVTGLVIEDGSVRGVRYLRVDQEGTVREETAAARRVIMAAGAMETYRILASSGLRDRFHQLGRGFTFTLERTAYLPSCIRRSRKTKDMMDGTFANLAVKRFYDSIDGVGGLKGGKFSLYDALNAELPARHVKNLGLVAEDLATFLREEQTHYAIKVSFKGESIPWQGKFLRMGGRRNRWGVPTPVVEYRPHPWDLELQRSVEEVLLLMASALGGKTAHVLPVPVGSAVVSAHQHGGVRAAHDRRRGVVNENCEVHEASGVYVVDAGFMPTSGGTNSTNTAMANAARVSHHAVSQL